MCRCYQNNKSRTSNKNTEDIVFTGKRYKVPKWPTHLTVMCLRQFKYNSLTSAHGDYFRLVYDWMYIQ